MVFHNVSRREPPEDYVEYEDIASNEHYVSDCDVLRDNEGFTQMSREDRIVLQKSIYVRGAHFLRKHHRYWQTHQET